MPIPVYLWYGSPLQGDHHFWGPWHQKCGSVVVFFVGHSKAVNTVCWSHSKRWFLGTSEDPTLCIWTANASESVLTMVTYQQLNQIKSLH